MGTIFYFKVLFREFLKIYSSESFFVAFLSLDDSLVSRLLGGFVLDEGLGFQCIRITSSAVTQDDVCLLVVN